MKFKEYLEKCRNSVKRSGLQVIGEGVVLNCWIEK